ncbi:hypothetical protein V2P20_11450 [Methylobacter sp. Wu1]|uniref:hypothetical protein n=1 Tax=Methylobacter sp. Wu1 TaxID=3119359 RepID=UPI002F92E435
MASLKSRLAKLESQKASDPTAERIQYLQDPKVIADTRTMLNAWIAELNARVQHG